jgi:hypothetical protein
MDLEKNLLIQVEGILAVTHQAEGDVVEHVLVGVDDLHKRRRVRIGIMRG